MGVGVGLCVDWVYLKLNLPASFFPAAIIGLCHHAGHLGFKLACGSSEAWTSRSGHLQIECGSIARHILFSHRRSNMVLGTLFIMLPVLLIEALPSDLITSQKTCLLCHHLGGQASNIRVGDANI